MLNNLTKDLKLSSLFIFVITSILFSPSLFNFYSNDDFFNLKLAHVNSLLDVINFFNLWHAPLGFGFYRPLTTQMFFFLGWILGLNSLYLHIIVSICFGLLGVIVYKFIKELTEDKTISILATFLYLTSSTHFGHLYYLSAFQEVGLGIFYLLSCLLFLKFLKFKSREYYLSSLFCFILALLSKESAVTLPITLGLIILWKERRVNQSILLKYIRFILPFLVLLVGYLYLHIFHYGLAKGDSYIWEISPKIINTFIWYLGWCLNIPEMLVDYVGPGLRVNSNLFKYYGGWISLNLIGLLIFFTSFLLLLYKLGLKKLLKVEYLFVFLWFLITLLPVLFLPWHKFSYELTLPLVGVVLGISLVIKQFKSNLISGGLLILWIIISYSSLQLSTQTSWIVQGGETSKRTYQYIQEHKDPKVHQIVFYDVSQDKTLPWSPTKVLQQTLSDQNFFDVFYPDIEGVYSPSFQPSEKFPLAIPSRKLLNY